MAPTSVPVPGESESGRYEAFISIHVYGTDVTRVGSSARRYYD